MNRNPTPPTITRPIHQLDGARKGLVLQFLVGSELIDPHDPVVQLEGADLTDLRAPPGLTGDRMDLDRTDLERADFHNAALLGGRSSHRSGKATFERADLRHANFENVELVDVVFLGTDLRYADFRDQVLEDRFLQTSCLILVRPSEALTPCSAISSCKGPSRVVQHFRRTGVPWACQ